MSQPRTVPGKSRFSSHYESPPRRDRSWKADRPGDVFVQGQPHGDMFGAQGPDQGFAFRLAGQFDKALVLADGEHHRDVVAGCVAVALKRASLFGRAPVIFDLRCAFAIFGFLGEADPELVRIRKTLFEEVADPHHYEQRRAVADVVSPALLRQSYTAIIESATDWETNLSRLAAS